MNGREILAALGLVIALTVCKSAVADPETTGVIVLATDGATDAAWPLAASVYADTKLRPDGLTDAHARVLAGEEGVHADVHELMELRAAVKGDDAASRLTLVALAQRFHVRAVVVVFDGTPPSARLFDVTTRRFETARYVPDEASTTPPGRSWNAALVEIRRVLKFGELVTAPPHEPARSSKAFYESPWFWVAVGVGLLAGGGVLLATTIQTSDAVHLQVHLP